MANQDSEHSLDAVVLGGGAAGLFILDALIARGFSAALLESRALGAGQTIQAQGIIHGGGKYALRRVRDLAAVQSIREMPARWQAHLSGSARPDLRGVQVLSQHCWLWDSRAPGLWAQLRQSILPIVIKGGLLHTPPRALPRDQWPELLRKDAGRVYAMAEPVIATGSLIEELARPHRERILNYDPGTAGAGANLQSAGSASQPSWRVSVTSSPESEALQLRARVVVLAAGAGNAAMLQRAGVGGEELMQRRPLAMVMLRGALPALFGHWMSGARTRLTITSAVSGAGTNVWAMGGQLAETCANESDARVIRDRARDELRAAFPSLDARGLEFSIYRAIRAEAKTQSAHRPSGVDLAPVAPGLWAAWPTKLALAPVLADAVVNAVAPQLGAPTPAVPLPADWPRPERAPYPWEQAEWETLQ